MNHNGCTCIVPFFNENHRIIAVLKKLVIVDLLDRIILVNDGSTDESLSLVEEFVDQCAHKQLHIISYDHNQGKSHAVSQGLQHVTTSHVLLFDADLIGVVPEEVSRVIQYMYAHPSIDMGLLRRNTAQWHVKILYKELILSGQRMLKTNDLKTLFALAHDNIDKYQLEVAINDFMYFQKKDVVRFPFSARNTYKHQKQPITKAIFCEFSMFRDIIQYQGLRGYIKRSLLFHLRHVSAYRHSKSS